MEKWTYIYSVPRVKGLLRNLRGEAIQIKSNKFNATFNAKKME